MKCIKLFNGAEMPLVGLGTWQAVTAKDKPETADAEVEEAIRYAVAEVGYRHIDTAFAYFVEKAIGQSLAGLFEKNVVRREDLFLTTKLPPNGMHADKVEHFLQLSLKDLQTEYVDLYLLHKPFGVKYLSDANVMATDENGVVDADFGTDLLAVWKAMEAQVDAGRAKAIGLSNVDIEQVGRVLKNCRIKPANVQCEASVFFQNKELRDFCDQNGISFCAYSPLGSPGASETIKALGGEAYELNILKCEEILEVAAKYGKTPAQIALKLLVQQGTAVLPKSSNPKRLRENFEIFDFKLTNEDLTKLEGLDRGEAARVFSFKKFFNCAFEKHPECRV